MNDIKQKCDADNNPLVGCEAAPGGGCSCEVGAGCDKASDPGCFSCVDWESCQSHCASLGDNCGKSNPYEPHSTGIPKDIQNCVTKLGGYTKLSSDTHCVANLQSCCNSDNKCDGSNSICGGNCNAHAQNFCDGLYDHGASPGPSPGPNPGPGPHFSEALKSSAFVGKTVVTASAIIVPILVSVLLYRVLVSK